MNILHWIGFALVMAALSGAFLRRSFYPVAYALGFWGSFALLVADIRAGWPWGWCAIYALGMVVYIAAMMDALSDRRQAKKGEDINV